MKRTTIIITLASIAGFGAMILQGCAAPQAIMDKSGAQLWGENCMRCHDAPSPAEYSDLQWEVTVMHMKLRSNGITDAEAKKITAFLQSAN